MAGLWGNEAGGGGRGLKALGFESLVQETRMRRALAAATELCTGHAGPCVCAGAQQSYFLT